jgi:hypothetical protein
MGKLQPVVFCAALGAEWDPDAVVEAVSALLGTCDRDALPVIVGPEFLCASFKSGQPIAPMSPNDDRLAALVDFSSMSERGLVIAGTAVTRTARGLRNTATVLYRQQELIQVDKLKQGGPAEPALWDKRLPVMQQANVHPDTFLLNYGESSETRFGVEICTDKGEMRSFLVAQNSPIGKWPEVYIQTSYGMSLSNYLTWNASQNKFMYRRVMGGNLVWTQGKYTADTTEDATMVEFADFALHDTAPGMFIQSDGHTCRVGYKFPGRPRYTLVPPLGSVPIKGSKKLGSGEFMLSAHLFPAVKLQLLEPYWT